MKSRTILLAAAFICAGMLGQAQIKLTFNPEKGVKYAYRQVVDQKMNNSFGGQDMAMTNVLEMLTELNIKEKNSNEVTLDYTYKEIAVTVSSAMMNYKVDTKNAAGNTSDTEKIIASVYDCIIGKPLQVSVSTDGTVKSVTGYNAISDEISIVLGNLGEMERQMSGMVLQSFSEEAVKNMIQQIVNIYPGKEVKIGDSWVNDNSFITAGMSNNQKNTSTLKSVGNDVALLDVVAVQTMKPGGGMGMEGEIKGDFKGETRINVKTGMIVKSSSEGVSKGKFSGQGMEMSMEITTKTSFTLQ